MKSNMGSMWRWNPLSRPSSNLCLDRIYSKNGQRQSTTVSP